MPLTRLLKPSTCGIVIYVFLASCNSSPGTGNLSGKVEGAAGQTVFLQRFEQNQTINLDSSVVGEDGSFTLSLKALPLDFYRVALGDTEGAIVLVDSTQSPIFAGSLPQLNSNYSVSGSKYSEDLVSFYRFADAEKQVLDSMQQAIRNSPSQERMALSAAFRGAVSNYQNRVADRVKAMVSSPAALAALNDLNPEEHFELYVAVTDSLKPIMGHNPYWQQLSAQIENRKLAMSAAENIAVGKPAPDIALPTPGGEVVSLSSFKGKYVLIDFWASWCGPCRRENPTVVKAYEKYKPKGFEIFGVSLDNSRDKWIQAIEADGLTWPQVSDLKGWQAAPAAVYNVRSIPATFLVDPQGIIIARDLRGAALETKLAELL